MLSILVTPTKDGYKAIVDLNPTMSGEGESSNEAIGALVSNWMQYFNISVISQDEAKEK